MEVNDCHPFLGSCEGTVDVQLEIHVTALAKYDITFDLDVRISLRSLCCGNRSESRDYSNNSRCLKKVSPRHIAHNFNSPSQMT
jgi:hypothetical protein